MLVHVVRNQQDCWDPIIVVVIVFQSFMVHNIHHLSQLYSIVPTASPPLQNQVVSILNNLSLANMSGAVLELVVVGAHMSNLPLNHQLVNLGAQLGRACRTAPFYKMFSLGSRPALIRQPPSSSEGCMSIDVEIWELPLERVGEFLRDGVKAPLALGDIELDDGSVRKGFVGETYGVEGKEDITWTGGWRAYLSQVNGN